jgi:hypothetical protein
MVERCTKSVTAILVFCVLTALAGCGEWARGKGELSRQSTAASTATASRVRTVPAAASFTPPAGIIRLTSSVTPNEQTAKPGTPAVASVDGWTGSVIKLCSMDQFDDYFLRSDGEKYGIEGTTAEIKVQIECARCQPGMQIRVWGHLMTGIPEVKGRRIVAERVEVVSTPPTPVPELGQGQTQVDGWQGRVVPLCRYNRLDNYFEREDGVCFGIDAEAPSVKNELYIAECEGHPVRVWGVLHRGVDDYRGARIVVERLEH